MKIAFVETTHTHIATYPNITWTDATGLTAPINNNTTVFGVLCDNATAALIEADPECLVHTDGNLFLDFDDTNPELHWQNELQEWLNA